MSRLSIALAMTVVVVSLMWGTAILSSDVPGIAAPAAESGTLALICLAGALVMAMRRAEVRVN